MISVIIPLYNKENEIARAIESVLSQTFQDFELLIINDGSTDNSLSIAKSFSDKRIKIFSKSNGGVSSARNHGIRQAENKWIALLDADDWWAPSFLISLLELSAKYPEASIYCCRYVHVNDQGEVIHLNRFPDEVEGYFELYNHLFAVNSSSVLVRKRVFDDCGYFDELLTHGEDTDMWIRIGMKTRMCYTSEMLSFCYIGGDPLTRSGYSTRKLKRNLLSKIDTYMTVGGERWDSLLLERKIRGLERFYIIDPFNKDIRRMIKSIPPEKLDQLEKSVLKEGTICILYRHFRYKLHGKWKIVYRTLRDLIRT